MRKRTEDLVRFPPPHGSFGRIPDVADGLRISDGVPCHHGIEELKRRTSFTGSVRRLHPERVRPLSYSRLSLLVWSVSSYMTICTEYTRSKGCALFLLSPERDGWLSELVLSVEKAPLDVCDGLTAQGTLIAFFVALDSTGLSRLEGR